jgi:hypothetical protein
LLHSGISASLRVCVMRIRQRVGALPCLLWLVLPGCGDTSVELFPSLGARGAADGAAVDEASADAAGQIPDEDGAGPGCRSNADCTSRQATQCEPALHVCVQCIEMDDCAGHGDSTCNRVTNRCVSPCQDNHDCPSSDVCDVAQGACAECLDDSQCASTGDEKICSQETCVECESAQDCPAGSRCWQATCVACVTDADCRDGGTCSTDHACD